MTTEEHINHFLQTTRKLYEKCLQEGNKLLAICVLRRGSTVSEDALKALNHKNKPFQCPNGHILKGKLMQEAYIKHGTCLDCDHLTMDRHWEEEYDPQ